MSKKNSLEAKKLRRSQKLRPREYPNYWALKSNTSRSGRTTSTKLVKRDQSGHPTLNGLAMRPLVTQEVIYETK